MCIDILFTFSQLLPEGYSHTVCDFVDDDQGFTATFSIKSITNEDDVHKWREAFQRKAHCQYNRTNMRRGKKVKYSVSIIYNLEFKLQHLFQLIFYPIHKLYLYLIFQERKTL